MIIQVDIPDAALSEVIQALEEARKYAREKARDQPLRASGKPTKRYDWLAATFTIEGVVHQLRSAGGGRSRS